MSHWIAKDIPSQAGKLAIITGANSGIGYHSALELARAGATVILACRNEQRAAEAKAKIIAAVPQAQVEVAKVDVADLDSIKTFAEAFVASDRKLDILINNAGVMAYPTRQATKQGFEAQFGTNHLGHFALTGELMPALIRTPGSRVVTVASIAHKGGRMRYEDPNWERDYDPRKAYSQSKLANVLFGLELDRRLKRAGKDVSSIIAHPASLQPTSWPMAWAPTSKRKSPASSSHSSPSQRRAGLCRFSTPPLRRMQNPAIITAQMASRRSRAILSKSSRGHRRSTPSARPGSGTSPSR